MCRPPACSSGHIPCPSSSPRPRTSGRCPRRPGALRCHPGRGGRKVRKSRQLCTVSPGKDPVPLAHLARILPPLQVPSAHHARGQVALVHLVAVADLVVNELHLGLPQLWGGVFCKAEEPWGRVSLIPPLPPGPSNHSRIVPAPCRCWAHRTTLWHSQHPPSPSFSLVFPKPVMKQDLPVWNRWPCMGRQAGRT